MQTKRILTGLPGNLMCKIDTNPLMQLILAGLCTIKSKTTLSWNGYWWFILFQLLPCCCSRLQGDFPFGTIWTSLLRIVLWSRSRLPWSRSSIWSLFSEVTEDSRALTSDSGHYCSERGNLAGNLEQHWPQVAALQHLVKPSRAQLQPYTQFWWYCALTVAAVRHLKCKWKANLHHGCQRQGGLNMVLLQRHKK